MQQARIMPSHSPLAFSDRSSLSHESRESEMQGADLQAAGQSKAARMLRASMRRPGLAVWGLTACMPAPAPLSSRAASPAGLPEAASRPGPRGKGSRQGQEGQQQGQRGVLQGGRLPGPGGAGGVQGLHLAERVPGGLSAGLGAEVPGFGSAGARSGLPAAAPRSHAHAAFCVF